MHIIARRAPRITVTVTAKCRVCRQTYALNMIDLSEFGCKLVTGVFDIRPGDRICLRPHNLEGVWGDVIWARYRSAGVRFDRPIHPAVVEHLAREYADTAGVESSDEQRKGLQQPRRVAI